MSAQYFFHRIILQCAPHILYENPSSTYDVDQALAVAKQNGGAVSYSDTTTGAVPPPAAGTVGATTAAEAAFDPNAPANRVLTRAHPVKTQPATSGGHVPLLDPHLIDREKEKRPKSVHANPAKRKAEKKLMREKRERALAEHALRKAEEADSDRMATTNLLNPASAAMAMHRPKSRPFVVMNDASPARQLTPSALAKSGGESSSAVALSHDNESCLATMFYYLDRQVDFAKVRKKQDFYFAMFDPIKRCTVDGILADTNSDEHFYIPKPLLDRVSADVSGFLSSLRTEYDDKYVLCARCTLQVVTFG